MSHSSTLPSASLVSMWRRSVSTADWTSGAMPLVCAVACCCCACRAASPVHTCQTKKSKEKKRKEKKRKEKKRKKKKRKEKKVKENKRKDFAFWRQPTEEPRIIPGCPGPNSHKHICGNKDAPIVIDIGGSVDSCWAAKHVDGRPQHVVQSRWHEGC